MIHKILVYGAGVLGSLYAGKLQQAGYAVTLLARGQRLQELRERGLWLQEDGGELERIEVGLADRLNPDDAYDLVLVIVRKDQLAGVLPALAGHTRTPNVLFMVNNAEGPAPLAAALGSERVLLGFAGAGGQRVDGVVRYHLTRGIQATTLGEPDGRRSERLAQIAQALRAAGFPVAICDQMDAWLKTHVALVSPIANALYLAGGDNYRLARTRDGLILSVRALKEGLHVLRALGIAITPGYYQWLAWLSEPLLVAILQKGLNTSQAELVMARHANTARGEMRVLAEEFRELARRSGLATPAIDTLFRYLDPSEPPVAAGQANLRMDWKSALVWGGALLSAGLLAGWAFRRRFS